MSNSEIDLGFWDHVEELRVTIIKVLLVIAAGTGIAFFFYPQIFQIITSPYQNTLSNQLVLLSPGEGISTIFKMSFWVGLVATSPLWLYLLFKFVAPGMKSQERKVALPFTFCSLLFMALGFLFAFTITIPLANNTLSQINQTIGTNLWSLSHYLDYTILLLFANGLAFECCVTLFFLIHMGWISSKQMRDKRKGVIVFIFIASAILTPPDALTQVLLALPLMGIYEAAILYANIIKRELQNSGSIDF